MHCALLKHLSSTFFLHLDSDPFKLLTPNLNIFIHKSFDNEGISTLYKTFSMKFYQQSRGASPVW